MHNLTAWPPNKQAHIDSFELKCENLSRLPEKKLRTRQRVFARFWCGERFLRVCALYVNRMRMACLEYIKRTISRQMVLDKFVSQAENCNSLVCKACGRHSTCTCGWCACNSQRFQHFHDSIVSWLAQSSMHTTDHLVLLLLLVAYPLKSLALKHIPSFSCEWVSFCRSFVTRLCSMDTWQTESLEWLFFFVGTIRSPERTQQFKNHKKVNKISLTTSCHWSYTIQNVMVHAVSVAFQLFSIQHFLTSFVDFSLVNASRSNLSQLSYSRTSSNDELNI